MDRALLIARNSSSCPLGRALKRHHDIDDSAHFVIALCSDFASFAVGKTFAIDGGYTAR
jgi:enoyl-[acyl-carrier-protein] reductase (NADH)